MGMHNPPHPGKLVAECIKSLELTVTEAAKGLGVTRKNLSELVNGHIGISATMAIRLSIAFGSTPDCWLRMQVEYDLWHAKQKQNTLKVKSFKKCA